MAKINMTFVTMKSISNIPTILHYLLFQVVYSTDVPSFYKYPFVVSVQAEGSGHICSGSLVGLSWVLTSAHCVLEYEKSPDKIFILAGEPNTPDEQMRFVKKIYCHNKFESESMFNNIALILTDKPFHRRKSVDIRYVPKYTMHIEMKTHCKEVEVIGLEAPKDLRRMARSFFRRNLESYTHQVLSEKECAKRRKFAVLKHTFCGYAENMTACLYDTGGPAVCDGLIYGINFYGCPWDESPSYFTRVDRYLIFLERIMGREAPYPISKRSSADKLTEGCFMLVSIILMVFTFNE